MTRVSILTASLGSVLFMAALFVTVALAAGPATARHGHGGGHSKGVCFLHDLAP